MLLSVKTQSWASSLDASSALEMMQAKILHFNKTLDITDFSASGDTHKVTYKDGVLELRVKVCSCITGVCGHLESQIGPVSCLREISQLIVTLLNNQITNVRFYSIITQEHFSSSARYSAPA